MFPALAVKKAGFVRILMRNNMKTNIQIKKLDHFPVDCPLPNYATEGSAGMDLYAAIEETIIIAPREVKIIPTGIAIALPQGFEAQIRSRSGLAAKNAIAVLNSPGTIDSDYRGEIKVILINHGKEEFRVEKAMRIAQAVISKYEQIAWVEMQELDDTARGEGGFGSTGH